MSNQRRSERHQFWVILTVMFLGYVGISMPYLIFPPLFLNVDYTFLPEGWSESSRGLFLGITLAAYPLGQFIGSPILGSLSDEYGRKPLLAGSLLIAALCNVLTGIAIAGQNLWLLIASRWMAGLMEGNIAIARAMCADLKLISKQETFGKTNAVTAVAYLIGPLLGAALTDPNLFAGLTIATPFFLSGILSIALAGLSMLTLKNYGSAALIKTRTLWQRFNFVQRLLVLFTNRRLKIFLIASTYFTLAVDIFYQFGPVYLTLKWTLSPTQLILYNSVLCVGLAIGNGWLPALLASHVSSRRSTLGSIGAFALLLVGVVCADSHSLMVFWFLLCGFAIGLGSTLLTVDISDAASDQIQGEVMGTQLSLRVLGDGMICLFGGALLILSPKIILVVAAGISLATMGYTLRAGRGARGRT